MPDAINHYISDEMVKHCRLTLLQILREYEIQNPDLKFVRVSRDIINQRYESLWLKENNDVK